MKAYHFLMGFLLSAILIGVAWGDTTEDTKYIYNMDQSVQGNGFFSSYQDLAATELSLTASRPRKRKVQRRIRISCSKSGDIYQYHGL